MVVFDWKGFNKFRINWHGSKLMKFTCAVVVARQEWSVANLVTFLYFCAIHRDFGWTIHSDCQCSRARIACIDNEVWFLTGLSFVQSSALSMNRRRISIVFSNLSNDILSAKRFRNSKQSYFTLILNGLPGMCTPLNLVWMAWIPFSRG